MFTVSKVERMKGRKKEKSKRIATHNPICSYLCDDVSPHFTTLAVVGARRRTPTELV